MNNRLILLVAGKSGSGKDILSDFFICKLGFRKLAFATILKLFVSKKFDIPLTYTLTQEGKKKIINGKTIRDLLIETAQLFRKDDPDYFAKQIVTQINTTSDPIIISDFRYPNEYEFLKKYFEIKTVNVVRDINNGIDDLSEIQLDSFNFDYTVYNNYSTINELYDYLGTLSIK